MKSVNGKNGEDEYVVKSEMSPIEIPRITCVEYIVSKMREYSDLLALIKASDESELTYGKWLEQSEHFASSLLRQEEVTKSDLVLFYGDNSLPYAISMLGVILLGNTFSPVTPANGSFELTQQIRDSEGSILVIDQAKISILKQCLNDSEYSETFHKLKLIVIMNCRQVDEELITVFQLNQIKLYDQMMMEDVEKLNQIPYFETKQEDYFVIIYTSGTTGLPKGAIHSQYSFLASLLQCRNPAFKPSKTFQGRMSTWFPIGHASGTLVILNTATTGITSILYEDNNLDTLLSGVDKYKINFLPIPPSHAPLLAEGDYHRKYDLSSLGKFSFGGAKVAQGYIDDIKSKFGKDVIGRYAATEFLGSVGGMKYAFDETKKGNVGQPLAGVEMKIIDLESGRSLPANRNGEVCFRGPPCFVGYLNNEKATRDTIDLEGWYHSGDIGYYDSDGCLYIVDRVKELVKYKYWSIAPAEIEDFLYRHPSVAEVCVVGVKHVSDGQLLRAYVQLHPGKNVSADELIQYVQDNIGFQKRLRGGVYFVEQIPRTAIGKVDRKYFRNLIKDELITDVIP